ncbi:MAG: aminotransferase class V-fold PLP-dependent enzyme [Dehalococcoidia bacterium]|nr:aminotransferase class V-fold PLP-dependent enzyme [Dehalococcoidia bacterium]
MNSDQRIYLDHAATTPLDPRVLEAMLPYLASAWGNPSSIYYEGREARKALEAARRDIAAVLGAKPNDIVLTSGGSESDNAAIRGVAYAAQRRGRHIITSAIEHHAVLHAVEQLTQEGFEATYLPVDGEGFVSPEGLRAALRPETTLVSIMYANNEVGTIEPIAELARAVKEYDPRIVFHTDAVQAAGSLDINVDNLGVDMLSLAAHKIYGPKGVGALYVRPRTPFAGQMLGGSQERNRRAGTENVAGAVGLAKALTVAYEELDTRNAHLRDLRDHLWRELPRRLPGVRLTGPSDPERRLPNSFSCCLEGLEGEAVLIQMDLNGIAASSGSACTTGSLEVSHVLTAMGIDEAAARGSLRLTLGRDNTRDDIDTVLERLPGLVEKLRRLAPSRPVTA